MFNPENAAGLGLSNLFQNWLFKKSPEKTMKKNIDGITV